ncbi:MAG: non-ribosomal peptide synthetase [Anaerolineae bacterium]|nr:non-ribosomal peptide synthetase [Anaerolineae bacterium]
MPTAGQAIVDETPTSDAQGAIDRLAFDLAEVDLGIPARFEKAAAYYADLTAVDTTNHHWTYARLNQRANQVAHALLAHPLSAPAPLALLMDHDAPLIAATMGALKAGLFYSVLDPDQPAARLRFLLEDLDAPWLLTDAAHLAQAESIAPSGCRIRLVDHADYLPARCDNPGLPISPTAYMAVLYTSGSTGLPKGVIRQQRAALHRIWQDYHDPLAAPGRRVSVLALPVAGGKATSIVKGLSTGVALLPFDVKRLGVEALARWLTASRVSDVSFGPALLRQLLAVIAPDHIFPTLRRVRLGGDVVFRRDIEQLRPHILPDCEVIHGYSSSEGGRIARFRVPADLTGLGEVLPVGYPVPDQTVLILDEHRQPLPPGEVGEIAVHGRYIAPGYWRRPELTDDRFIPDPAMPDQGLYLTGDLGRFRPDGLLELAGRRDFQVKIRGYRVGLGSVESALLAQPGVAQAVVVARPDAMGEDQLVAYVVLQQRDLTVSELRQTLAASLPDYAVPSVFMTLDALPLTANNKVDRRALPLPPRSRPHLAAAYVAPATAVEIQVARLWADVLGLDEVGVRDNFLDLGGHSLLASQLVARVNRAFGLHLPLRALFQAATVAEMAARVEAGLSDGHERRLAELVGEVESLSEADAEQLFHEAR